MCTYRLSMRAGLSGLVLLAGSALAAAAEIEAGLPKQTTAVLIVNLKQLLHTPVIKQHGLASLRRLCRNTESVRAILEALGFDPFRDLDRLTAASVGLGEKAEVVLILRGRFDTARFHLAAKMLVKEHSDRFVMHKDENLKYVSIVSTGRHGSIIFGTGVNSTKGTMMNVVQTKGCLLDAFGNDCLTLLDKNTLVAATSERLLKETCQRIAAKDTSTLNKPMRRLLTELDGKQTILFALRPGGGDAEGTGIPSAGSSRGCIGLGGFPAMESTPRDRKPSLFTSPEKFDRVPPRSFLERPFYDPADLIPFANAKEESSVPTQEQSYPISGPRPIPAPPPLEAKEESSKPSSYAVCGSISVANDLTLRCAVRTAKADDARSAMKGFDEVRLRADGLMTFLAGSSKEYAFLKEIPRSFAAVREGRLILIEGRLPAETLVKILGTWSVKKP